MSRILIVAMCALCAAGATLKFKDQTGTCRINKVGSQLHISDGCDIADDGHTLSSLAQDIADLQAQFHFSADDVIDGGFSDITTDGWSTCAGDMSGSCSVGTTTQSQALACDNPRPKFGGAACSAAVLPSLSGSGATASGVTGTSATVTRNCDVTCCPGYYSSGTGVCTAYGGSCPNGVMQDQADRTKENHCKSCDAGYTKSADETSCTVTHACSTGSGAACASCQDPADRTGANHCKTCNEDYKIVGLACVEDAQPNVPVDTYSCGAHRDFTASRGMRITASLRGGDGGRGNQNDHRTDSSRGGLTTVTFDVVKNDVIRLTPGCKGFDGSGSKRPGGGGGAGTAILVNGNVIAVAGGGGGSAGCFANGGSGGGTTGGGGDATYYKGNEAGGGTQTGPGNGGTGDRGEPAGSAGNGNDGGMAGGHDVYSTSRSWGFGRGGGSTQRSGDCGGGGGGGGYYGGGGGGAGGHGHSGGGGSGFCASGSGVVSCTTSQDTGTCQSIVSSHGPTVTTTGCSSSTRNGQVEITSVAKN